MLDRYHNSSVKQTPPPKLEFGRLKIGTKNIDDVLVPMTGIKKTTPSAKKFRDVEEIYRAIERKDLKTLRDISNYWYYRSGIYARIIKYFAYMYKYDWYITPYFLKKDTINTDSQEVCDKIEESFMNVLLYMDNFQVKRFCGDVALKVIRDGCYYGYIVADKGGVAVQELPQAYCRSRYTQNNYIPIIEFNVKFFDDVYTDEAYRQKILKSFPKEIQEGYRLYRTDKLKKDFNSDEKGWYTLNPGTAIKFNINNSDIPIFMSVIPALIQLEETQGLENLKQRQKLLKIIIQKMPLDKNGDMIFDMDEMAEMHANAVRMLGAAIGVDVLTTLADVDVEELADSSADDSSTAIDNASSSVYDQAGVSQMQFNTDGNIALEKSMLNDAATMLTLVQQFEDFLNLLLTPFNKSKKIKYKAQFLGTTIYNYQELVKLYKEQTQLGYSKMLPQVAMGLSQSSILANSFFENDILDLVNRFIPPLMSSTMNGQFLIDKDGESKGDGGSGRPELADDQKSEKTIQNQEAMS